MKHAATLPKQPCQKAQDRAPVVSRFLLELDESTVIDRAIEVIGEPSEAMRWLGTPIRALDYATPVSLLHDSEGRNSVLTVLGRLEHGVL